MATGETYTASAALKQSYLKSMLLVAKSETPLISKYLGKGTKPVNKVHYFAVDKIAYPTSNNASVEGAELYQSGANTVATTASSVPANVTENFNYTQIIKKVMTISGTQQAVEYNGIGNYLAHQEKKALKTIAMDLEYAVMLAPGAAGDATTARQMRGIGYWAENVGTTATATSTATETGVNTVLQAMFLDGSAADLLIVEPTYKKIIDAWTANGATRYIMTSEKEVVATVNVYDSTYGRIILQMHAILASSGKIMIIKKDAFKISYLREPKIEVLGKNGDGWAFQAIMEATLECVDPDGAGQLTVS